MKPSFSRIARASANKYEPFPTLEGSINCDVCVVGGGYTGLSSA
ncbi:hypothetical protein AB0171_26500, partial [Klebsiella pneumoniae]